MLNNSQLHFNLFVLKTSSYKMDHYSGIYQAKVFKNTTASH